MKKRIVALLIMLVVCVSVFAGCNLFVRDDQLYYEATVQAITFTDSATGKQETVNISRRDVLVAYNSYGVQYEQTYGMGHAETIEQCLKTIVNQKLIKRAVEDYYKELNSAAEPLLNDREKTYLWDSTFDAMYENLKGYYYTASGAKAPADPEAEKTKLFTEYQPHTLVERVVTEKNESDQTETTHVEYDIKLDENSSQNTVRKTYEARKVDGKDVDYEYVDEADKKQTFRELMYQRLVTDNLDSTKNDAKSVSQWTKAFNDYVADVKENYSYKTFATNKDAFLFEMDRVYNILKDNYFADKYTEIYKYQNGSEDISQVSVQNVLESYLKMYQADYNTYAADKAAFDSAIVNNAAGMDYVYEGANAANFFKVAYIKIALSDDDKTDIENIKNNPNYSTQQKNDEVQAVYDALTVDILDEYGQDAVDRAGNKLAAISPEALLQEIREAISGAGDDNNAKAEAFRKYLYQYNDDTSQQNAEANVVFGIDYDGKTVLSSSTFADNDAENDSEFETAIRALYNNGAAQFGNTTDVVQVDGDGLYIFFYAGKLENWFDPVAATHADYITKLTTTRQNVFSAKTVFDAVYDQLSQDDPFSSYQSEHIKQLTSQIVSLKSRDENGQKIVLETVSMQRFDKNMKGL